MDSISSSTAQVKQATLFGGVKPKKADQPKGETRQVKAGKDEFTRGEQIERLNLFMEASGYKEVETGEASRMIGYFTQKMESQGFPWEIYQPTGGRIRKKKKIGEFEALRQLQANDKVRKNLEEQLERGDITESQYFKKLQEQTRPVIFQPKRVIGIGFSPPQFNGKDVTGKQASGKVDVKSGGMEKKFGEPIEINNFSELKLFYELYNPDIQIEESKSQEITKAARHLSYFTKGTMNGQYPWKLYKPQTRGQRFIAQAKAAIKSGGIGAGLGALAASLFSIPAIALGAAAAGPIGLAAGAGIGAAIGAFRGARSKRKGKEINAFEALSRLHQGKTVYFQEQKKREIGLSIPFPIGMKLGNLSFYSEHGEGSKISNFDELELFHKMQEQK